MHPYNQWIQTHHELDAYTPAPEQVLTSRRAYYGMISYVDDKVGQLLASLDRLSLREETMILFTSDHGDQMGEHGMWFKRTFYDGSTKVPLIVSGPEISAPSRIAKVVSLVDLFPTLLEVTNLPQASHPLDGHSFAGLLDGTTSNWKDAAIIEYMGEGAIAPMRCIRQGHYKYVFVEGCQPLLFDLEMDPLEQTNLSGLPDMATIEEILHAAILKDFDPSATKQAILRSQEDRRMVAQALSKGNGHSWAWPVKTPGVAT